MQAQEAVALAERAVHLGAVQLQPRRRRCWLARSASPKRPRVSISEAFADGRRNRKRRSFTQPRRFRLAGVRRAARGHRRRRVVVLTPRPRVDRRCAGRCARDADRGARRRHRRCASPSTTTSRSKPARCWWRSIRATIRSRSTRRAPSSPMPKPGDRRAEQRADHLDDRGEQRDARRRASVEQARGGVDAGAARSSKRRGRG